MKIYEGQPYHRTAKAEHGTDREINPSNDEHQRHACRDHGECGNTIGQRDKSAVTEEVIAQQAEEQHQPEPDHEHGRVLREFLGFEFHGLAAVAPRSR